MIKISYFFYSTCFSLFFHYLIISYFQEIKDKEKEIFIVELSKFQKFSPQINAPVITTPEVKKEIKKPIKEKEKKEIIKKKINNKIPAKKTENKKAPQKKEIDLQKTKFEEKEVNEQKKEKIVDTFRKNIPMNEDIPKEISRPSTLQLPSKKNKKNPDELNKELRTYFTLISKEINILAAKSYPIQSIKRREQGTIIVIVTIDEVGSLKNISFEKKRPKRLFEATKLILRKYIFPPPPKIILSEKNTLKIKIPVNFILK